MKKLTQKQIDAEITALEICKDYVPRFTIFGDDNFRKLDLQIEYLRGEIDTTAEEFEVEYNCDEEAAIIKTQEWEEGRSSVSPSSGWDSFKPKAKSKKKS